jgi:hypothetical protein
MEYRQSRDNLVPARVTLKAEAIQFAAWLLLRRIPDILTGSRVQVIDTHFSMKGCS